VLEALESHYGNDWIRVIYRQVNGGPGAARNTGWNVAGQPYIAFLDADDAWHPRKIEIQLQYMQAHPEVAITGHRAHQVRKREEIAPLPERYQVKPITKWQMLISNRLSTPTVMLRREIEFRFEPAKWHSEDYLLWLKIICKGYKGAFIDLELAYFFKAPYGARGLSSQLWAMEKGELETYRRLRNEQLISWFTLLGLSTFSMVKYARRVVLALLRRWKGTICIL